MQPHRRTICLTATLALLAATGVLAGSAPALAQASGGWRPSGNVELIVGAAAGGAVDRTARNLQTLLRNSGAIPGATVSVVNRPGAGQTAAMAYIAQHAGSPNHLVLMSPSVVNSALTMGLAKPHQDVTPILKMFDGDLLYSAGTHSGIKTVEDLVARMRADIRSVSFAFSTSAGNTSHISIAQLASQLGGQPRDLRIVVNAAGSATVAQVAGGHVDVGITSTFTIQPMVTAGRATFLAVAGPSRLAALPDVPTFREKGYDVVATAWYAIAGAKGITAEQARFWEQALTRIMQSDEAKQIARRSSWNIDIIPAAQLGAFFDKEWDSQRSALIALGLLRQ